MRKERKKKPKQVNNFELIATKYGRFKKIFNISLIHDTNPEFPIDQLIHARKVVTEILRRQLKEIGYLRVKLFALVTSPYSFNTAEWHAGDLNIVTKKAEIYKTSTTLIQDLSDHLKFIFLESGCEEYPELHELTLEVSMIVDIVR